MQAAPRKHCGSGGGPGAHYLSLARTQPAPVRAPARGLFRTFPAGGRKGRSPKSLLRMWGAPCGSLCERWAPPQASPTRACPDPTHAPQAPN